MEIYAGPTPANLACLPVELRHLPQWILWRGVDRIDPVTGLVKLNKIPINAQTLTPADTTDARTWQTYQTCVDALPVALEEWELADPAAYRGGGLGYVLADTDPYTGLDLDRCVDPVTGAVEAWAEAFIMALASYTEITPSGTGIHIIVEGRLPPKGRRKGQVEMYDQWRFFTMTGWHLPQTPPTITACQESLTACWCRLFGPEVGQHVWLLDTHGTITNVTGIPWMITAINTALSGELFAHFAETLAGWPLAQCERAPAFPVSATPLMSDADVISKACAAHNGDKVKRLASGTWQQEYDSQSEADLAFCCLLAFWTRDPAQIDRLFRTTGLMRTKWDEARGAATYGSRTVQEALARQTETYTPAPTMVIGSGVMQMPSAPPGSPPLWGSPVPRLQLTDLADMLERDYPLPIWLIKDLIPEGLTFVVGSPKSSKTYLAYSLALSLSDATQSGNEWLGVYPVVNHGPVVYVSLEDDEGDSRWRIAELAPQLKTIPRERFLFLHGFGLPRFDEGLVDALREQVMEVYHPALVVLDPISYLYAPVRKSGDQFSEVKDMLLPLRWLGKTYHATILAVDHRRKKSADDVDIIETTYGSNAKIAVADAILVIVRDDKEITIHARVRKAGDQTLSLEFAFNSDGTAHWSWKGASSGHLNTGQYGDMRMKIMTVLMATTIPLSIEEILLTLNIPVSQQTRNHVRQILWRALKAKEVDKTSRGQYVWLGGA